MATLYLTEQGSKLGKTPRRLVVEKDDKTLLEETVDYFLARVARTNLFVRACFGQGLLIHTYSNRYITTGNKTLTNSVCQCHPVGCLKNGNIYESLDRKGKWGMSP